MTTIESKHVEIGKSKEDVFAYVRDMTNFKELLPQDRISDFQADNDSCSFKISGMATIGLKVKEVHEPTRMILESVDSPFSFTLDINVIDKGEGSCEAYQIAELDLNPMMKMMVQKPLTNLFDHISDRLKAVNS
jgi:carbon monoxide dehydrogenase subunit G